MALDFPSAPSPGDVFDSWEWDGTKWVPAPGGPLTGPIIGVTDGSDAAPGEVGEWFFQFGANVPITTGNIVHLGPITLPAGDWDAYGYLILNFAIASSVSLWVAGPIINGVSLSQVLNWPGGTATSGLAHTGVMPILRVSGSIANPPTYDVQFNATFSGAVGTPAAQLWVWARRVR